MARTTGGGHQNVRRVEDQAIAKADRERKANRTNGPARYHASHCNRNDNPRSKEDTWKLKLVNGKWQIT